MFPFHPQTAGNKNASRHNDTKTKDMKAKKYLYQTAGKAAALAACLLLFSCSGDDLADYGSANGGKHSDNICFSISAADKAMAKGASLADSSKAAGEYTAARFVMRSPDTDDTLCVQTVISDGINVTSFEGEAAATRGVPVTSLETYGSFHVQAHCTDNGTPVSQFYMDDNATNSEGTVWSTSQVRYWPGENRTLQFFAWAPANAAFTATPGSPESTTFEYEVPALAADQKDIVVATTDPYVGNYEQQVPLTFKHILTAVKFETGSQMQPGTIKSVALKGVKKSGTYTAFPTGGTTGGEGEWTPYPTAGDFSQELNKPTTGTETDGTPVTAEEGTFMMLSQTLPDGAEVEVVFQDGTSGQERTMSASIAGTQWPQGKTVTYKLSITPEYEFKLSDERILDAHYEIYTTSLVVSGVAAGQSWTITAPNDVTVQAQSDMNRWARQGYWTDRNINERGDDSGSARGTSSYSNSGSGEFPIAIFVPENIGDDKRSIALSISVNGNAVQTINIEQYAPSWYGSNIGCERLEGDPQPWGFYWSNDYALTFNLISCDENDRESLRQYVEWTQGLHDLSESFLLGWLIRLIFGNDIPDLSFVDMKKSNTSWWGGGIADEITINLGQLNTENIAESTDNGQQNTRDIYNFQGIQLVNEIINRIQNVGGYNSSMMKETGTGVFPTNNAAIACMKLNSWNVVTANNEEILQLTNNSPTPDWYLPASGEITGIHDDEIPLSGNYWTSTSVQGSHENAYKYDNSGAVSQERRDTRLNVRAVRKK